MTSHLKTQKYLFVTRKWPPAVGGMEQYSLELTEALKDFAEVEVIALPGRSDGSPPGALAVAGFFVSSAFKLTARGRRFDVIHFGDFVLFPLAVWARIVAPKARRAVTVHGLDLLFGRRQGLAPMVYRGFLAIARRLRSVVDCFIANSSATAGVARETGFEPVVPVPLGTSLAVAEPLQEPQPSSRFILYVGRLVKRKGADWFATEVLPRLPGDVEFRVVGTPWDDEVVAAVENAPRATYLGRVSNAELAELRRSAAVTVMPNRDVGGGDIEGFGLTAVEAVADGSLLVAAGIEGIVDAVRDQETGFLLPEGDVAVWADTINELLDWSPERKAGFMSNARRVVAEYYSWERVARDTLAAVNREAP